MTVYPQLLAHIESGFLIRVNRGKNNVLQKLKNCPNYLGNFS